MANSYILASAIYLDVVRHAIFDYFKWARFNNLTRINAPRLVCQILHCHHAKAGDCVFGPRGVPHTFAKVGEEEAKIILLFQPEGKMEEFFKAVNEGKLEKMWDDENRKFRIQHGFEYVGPPLTIPKKE